jgi:hypothetical protein
MFWKYFRGISECSCSCRSNPPLREGTALTRLVLSSPDPNGNAPKTPKKPKPYADLLAQVARAIHQRHPDAYERRDLGIEGIAKKLEAVLKHKHVPAAEAEAYLRRIDRNHAAACNSETWCKDGGLYAKGLRNYLAPTEERYEIEHTAPQRREPVRLMA